MKILSKKGLLILVMLLAFVSILSAQQTSSDELRLYKFIIQHRKKLGLPSIPLSSYLTKVAQTHARDLQENYNWNNTTCNLHSWSNKGNWKPVCYTADHRQAELMWSKPAELTAYSGPGFEIAFGGDAGFIATPEEALKSWKTSPGHYALIINKGVWKKKWNAVGIGVYKQYAVVWFGNDPDPEEGEINAKP